MRAQRIQYKSLRIGEALGRGGRSSALAQPGLRRDVLDDAQQRFADLRKDMDVLMAVDVIRRAAEGGLEGRKLPRDLDLQILGPKPTRQRAAGHRRKRREGAVAGRGKS